MGRDGCRGHLAGGGYKADPEIFCFSWGEEPSSDWDILGKCGVTTESNGFPIFGKNLFEFLKLYTVGLFDTSLKN